MMKTSLRQLECSMKSKVVEQSTELRLYFSLPMRCTEIHTQVLANQVLFHIQHKISEHLRVLFKLNPPTDIQFEVTGFKLKISFSTGILLSNNQVKEISDYFSKNKGELKFTGLKVKTNIADFA